MAARSFWKGYLKLSLVTCPVAMTPATSDSEKLRFHVFNRATGHRVRSDYVDAETCQPVDDDDQVKGYQSGADDYVMLEDEEIEAVALETTRTIDIEMFVPAESVGWIFYDRPHYLTPDDPVGEEAFSVIRQAMAATGMVGISRLVMYRRERAVLLEPRGRGIVLWTLRYGDEVRDPQAFFADIKSVPTEPGLLKMVTTLIERNTRSWDTEMVSDRCRRACWISSRHGGRRRVRHRRRRRRSRKGNRRAMSSISWTRCARASRRRRRGNGSVRQGRPHENPCPAPVPVCWSPCAAPRVQPCGGDTMQ
jgi:DNA end-binding protein Ku